MGAWLQADLYMDGKSLGGTEPNYSAFSRSRCQVLEWMSKKLGRNADIARDGAEGNFMNRPNTNACQQDYQHRCRVAPLLGNMTVYGYISMGSISRVSPPVHLLLLSCLIIIHLH